MDETEEYETELAELQSEPPQPEKTLRDEFAMAALNGLLASMTQTESEDIRRGFVGGKSLSLAAYSLADAMMGARKQ